MFVETLVLLFYWYLALGAIFGLYFVGWGAALIDHAAQHLPLGLRFLLWPASVALWPILLAKVIRHQT